MEDIFVWREAVILSKQRRVIDDTYPLRWLNTVLAVCIVSIYHLANHGKRKVAAHKLKLGK